MKYILFTILFFVQVKEALAQNNTSPKPCSAPESSQFDFWTGDWELTWNDTSKGTNSVKRILDGCAVQENFYDPALNYSGTSWSVYNPRTALWQQTWVDNQGAYISLTGKFENEQMILSTSPATTKDGKQSISRMIFYNIKPGSFDWNWENTIDNG